MAFVRAVALACAALVFATSPLRAQSLQRLTVTQLVLSADTVQPKLEVPFHLIITAHVRENVTSLDNVDLPILAEVEVLGDEHSLARSANGTTYREVIAVVAHHTGSITIAPVTLDAIDTRTGKPSRFSSNSLTIAVAGGALEPTVDIAAVFWHVVRITFYVVCGGALLLVVVLLLRRRPRPRPQMITLPQATPVARPARDPREVFRDALVTLRAEPTRATAMRVRHVARALVGASDTETLSDVLRRPLAADTRMRDVLRALERAAFTYESDLQAAIGRAIVALEGLLA